MDEEKNWMLMTYYCPTHGDLGLVKPIEITKKEINNSLSKKDSKPQNWLFRISSNPVEKVLNPFYKFIN